MTISTPDIIAYVGDVLVALLCASQLPTYYEAIRVRKSVDHISILPSVGAFANFVSWTIYAIVKKETQVLQVNIMGIAFSLVYFILLLLFARGAQWWRLVRLLALALGALAGIEAALVFALDVPTSTTATAVFAVLCNVAMFAGPITSVRAGLRLMDPSRLPVLLTVTGAACSMCWGAYGYLTTNPFIWVPNVCGILLNGGQLAAAAYVTLAVQRDPQLTKRLAARALKVNEVEGTAGLLDEEDGSEDA